nr:MAG TPA: hypothetical protein [Caudoviricetes sp.]
MSAILSLSFKKKKKWLRLMEGVFSRNPRGELYYEF